jgi:hypothetical protein
VTDSDQDWLDALAGRTPAGSDRAAIAEARRLRELIQRNVRAPDVPVATLDAQREAQLLERARHDGLIEPAQLTRRTGRLSHPIKAGGWVGLAAAIAGIAVALAVFFHGGAPRTQHFRGARESVMRIEAPDPTALKMQIIDELHAAGVAATGYESLGVEGIDARLPKPVPPRIRDVLTRHHLSVPDNGVLRIEIAAPSTP